LQGARVGLGATALNQMPFAAGWLARPLVKIVIVGDGGFSALATQSFTGCKLRQAKLVDGVTAAHR
jgi:hypothetical protein